MNLVFPRYVQFRTLTETYLCKVSADKVVLKIYDLAHTCLCQIKSATSDPRAILQRLSIDPVFLFKELMKEKAEANAFSFTSFDTSPSELVDCHAILKQAIIDLQLVMLNSILTFASFQKEDRSLAQATLTTAKMFMEEGELSQAVECYKKAFQFTKNPKEYTAIPELYKTLKEIDKARLSYLYLASYLIEAGDVAAALDSLEKASHLGLPRSLALHSALIMLSRHAKDLVKPERVKQLIQEAVALLQSIPPAKARVFGYQLLSQDVTNIPLYQFLSDLEDDENKRKQLLLKGALHALHGKEFSDAKGLCDQITPTTFEDVLVVFQSDQKKLTLLEEYAAKALRDKQFKPARQAFKVLLSHQEKPDYYEKLIDSYFKEDKLPKVFSKAIRLAELLVFQDSYVRAEEVCMQALKAAQNPDQTLQLYKKLEIAYLKTNSPKLEDLWARLGQAYEDTHDRVQAQQTYEKAQDKFKTQTFSFKLAHLLEQKGQLKESLLVYYAQAEQDILNQDLKGLEACYEEMLKVDLQLLHLDGFQKINLLSQLQILKLEREIARMSQRVEELEKTAKLELERPGAKRPRLEPLPEGCFGQEQWLQYFGDVGLEPPLPADIHAILASACPFWPGKTVQETHKLVLIPKTVNGRPLTLNYLGKLVKIPKQGHKTQYNPNILKVVFEKLGETPIKSSYWLLMTKDVLEGSRDKNYADQCLLMKTHSERTHIPYEVPHVLEAAAAIFLEHVQSGTHLYPGDPWTYTRCQEAVDSYQVVVGGFAPAGLFVGNYYDFDDVGVGAVRRSF